MLFLAIPGIQRPVPVGIDELERLARPEPRLPQGELDPCNRRFHDQRVEFVLVTSSIDAKKCANDVEYGKQ